MRDVITTVAGRRLVSAAQGELHEDRCWAGLAGLDFAKWGLAGRACGDWQQRLADRLDTIAPVQGV